MKKANYFTQKRQQEDLFMEQWCSKNNVELIRTQDEYCPFDYKIKTKKGTYVVEVKVRENYTIQQIDNFGGAILEKKKLEGILDYMSPREFLVPEILYFNFFKDGMRVYEIDNYTPNHKWYTKTLPGNSFSKIATQKEVTNLNKNAILYEHKD